MTKSFSRPVTLSLTLSFFAALSASLAAPSAQASGPEAWRGGRGSPSLNDSPAEGTGGTGNLGQKNFPLAPDTQLTPGAVCDRPTEYRYPERIPYCARDVDNSLKDDIIQTYDRQLGYKIEQMPRGDFKIDHFVPLCMGGANDRQNLWPQHKSVYTKTDRIEELLCVMMAQGKLEQDQAIAMMKDVKYHLEKADAMLSDLLARTGRQ